jgi:hypothetical protein
LATASDGFSLSIAAGPAIFSVSSLQVSWTSAVTSEQFSEGLKAKGEMTRPARPALQEIGKNPGTDL